VTHARWMTASHELLAANEIEAIKYSEADRSWDESPFRWLRPLSPKKKGAAIESLVTNWLNSLKYDVGNRSTSDHDRTIEGHRIEIKGSMLWSDNKFCFSQIRDQDYDHVLLVGIAPARVYAWLVPKQVAREHAKAQHAGGEDTKWLFIDPTNVQEWLVPYGNIIWTGHREVAA
jgi:hypothetical protein